MAVARIAQVALQLLVGAEHNVNKYQGQDLDTQPRRRNLGVSISPYRALLASANMTDSKGNASKGAEPVKCDQAQGQGGGRNTDTSKMNPADRKAVNMGLSDKSTMELLYKQGMECKRAHARGKKIGEGPAKEPAAKDKYVILAFFFPCDALHLQDIKPYTDLLSKVIIRFAHGIFGYDEQLP